MIRSKRVRAWLIGGLVLCAAGVATAVPLVASAASTLYEAESGTVSSGTVDSNHTGFTGTGFVNLTNAAGSYLELSVPASADGPVTLTFRYANGTAADRSMSISVNGAVVASALSFPSTGSWDTWATASVTATFAAGTNLVRATSNTTDGGPNLDSLTVNDGAGPSPTSSPSAPPTSPGGSAFYEAESGTISSGTVDSNHLGFTGTGFVNLTNAAGSYLELSLPGGTAGTVTLSWRYANGTAANRAMTISVNGGVVASALSFPTTGSWDTWATASVTATFAAGTNVVRATSNTADGGPNLDSLTVTGGVVTSPSPTPTGTGGGTDWSVKMVDSTIARFTPSTLGGWGYTEGLYLFGQYLVYQRTHNASYLTYIRQWADRFVGSDGSISNSFNNLDSMEAGNILLILYNETHQAKYLTASNKIWHRLMDANTTYPKTQDGGFEHGTSRPGQLWLDGTYMSLPFLLRYGQTVGGQAQTDANAMAVKQLMIYGGHLEAPNGLLWHAYDELKAQSWVVAGTSHSPEFWCRAIGWYGMSTVITLDTVPTTQANRGQLLTYLRNLVAAMKTYQDPASGRWFQVVDKGSRSDNWTETSCSAMYTYIISRSVEQGYVDASYKSVATKGYAGVLARISLGSDGRTNLSTISEGTNVGSYSYYIGRAQNTNDQHGLGSFLIMNEQLRRTG